MILVDPREGSGDLLRPLQQRTGNKAELFTLASGDFAFEGNGPNGPVSIGIERKQIGDMLSSMRSGRYAGDQLVGMGRDFDVVYLIIEGIWQASREGVLETWYKSKVNGSHWQPLVLATKEQRSHRAMFMYSELDKHIATLESKKNVIVIRSPNPMTTVWTIVDRYQWWSKEWEEHKSDEAIKFQADVTLFKCSLLRKIAAELPGIGWKRSKAVELHFKSIQEMICAKERDWASVEGVGPVTASKVVAALKKSIR